MQFVIASARLLLAVIFITFGLNGFFLFFPVPEFHPNIDRFGLYLCGKNTGNSWSLTTADQPIQRDSTVNTGTNRIQYFAVSSAAGSKKLACEHN